MFLWFLECVTKTLLTKMALNEPKTATGAPNGITVWRPSKVKKQNRIHPIRKSFNSIDEMHKYLIPRLIHAQLFRSRFHLHSCISKAFSETPREALAFRDRFMVSKDWSKDFLSIPIPSPISNYGSRH